jgi:hypothetical protein
MNNTTTIRALAVVIVVVLVFAAGSLAAATATSSFIPQPQNMICTHPANTTTINYIDNYKRCNK